MWELGECSRAEQEMYEEHFRRERECVEFMEKHPEIVLKHLEKHPEILLKQAFKNTMQKQFDDLLEHHRKNARNNPLSMFISESLKGL